MDEQVINTEQSKPMQAYKKCYVAFLDILGFKSLVETTDFSTIYRTLSDTILKAHLNTIALYSQYGINKDDIEVLCVSDSIIISIEERIPHTLEALVFLCGASQLQLLQNKGLLMRGGISCGDFYMDYSDITGSPILFGSAYNQAVVLEEKRDAPPRVVVSEILNEIVEGLDKDIFLKKDSSDGKYFVDFLRHISCAKCTNNDKARAKKCIVKHIENQLEASLPFKVNGKYLWTKKYITEFFPGEVLFLK